MVSAEHHIKYQKNNFLSVKPLGSQRCGRETPNALPECAGYSKFIAKKPLGFACEKPRRHKS